MQLSTSTTTSTGTTSTGTTSTGTTSTGTTSTATTAIAALTPEFVSRFFYALEHFCFSTEVFDQVFVFVFAYSNVWRVAKIRVDRVVK
jgi:hypothetical protein